MNSIKNILRAGIGLFAGVLLCTQAIAQAGNTYNRAIRWKPVQAVSPAENKYISFLAFEGAATEKRGESYLPVYIEKFPLQSGDGVASVSVTSTETVNSGVPQSNMIQSNPDVKYQVIYIERKPYLLVRFVPLINQNGQLQKVLAFTITVTDKGTPAARYKTNAANSWAANSVLSAGQWFKIAVSATGFYVIDKTMLTSMGINVKSINPQNIQLYGHGGAMLPQANSAPVYNDLTENAIQVTGESDGHFDDADKIIFYAQGTDKWSYDSTDHRFHHQKNVYATQGYYFLTIGAGTGKRVNVQSSLPGSPTQTVTSFDDYFAHEEDKTNFLHSGREWYGELFDKQVKYDFNVSFPGLVTSEPVYLNTEVVGRSFTGSNMTVQANGSQVLSKNFNFVFDDYTAIYVDIPNPVATTFFANGPSIQLTYIYNKPTLNSLAWLNYFELNARRELAMATAQMFFRDTKSVGSAVTQFNVSASGSLQVWDVTDPVNAAAFALSKSGNVYSFKLATPTLHEFAAFDGTFFLKPVFSGVVNNQNLHGSAATDMVIVSNIGFVSEANRLADFHRSKHNLRVLVTTPELIYNEFSSGTPDVSAIRNLMRMFYDRASTVADAPKYLLMFGDASYDYRNIRGQKANFVPTYESRNSYAPSASYCSDDFFGFLEPGEGEWREDFSSEESVDLGVGRFPVKTLTEAAAVVNKVIDYSSPAAMRDWRNDVAFVADDEDGSIHLDQSDELSAIIDTSYIDYNINKIFFDAYKQVSTPGGARYPDVETAINNQVNKGCLLINYTGHGGEAGWAHERVLGVSDVQSWHNKSAYPLFITATCEFSKHDDPDRTSAGELVLLNPAGGGIGLFTTVRLVYAIPNFILNKDVLYKNLFEPVGNRRPTMGEAIMRAKNATPDFNSRNFTLLGDPAQTLAYPLHRVYTTSINGKPVGNTPDTVKALSKITIAGVVKDKNGQLLTGFNGTLYVTVYDKSENYTTLKNDVLSEVRTFKLRKNVVYRGRASVTNGNFTFSFIVPKDISYVNGLGKISYYAENGVEDAAGNYENFVLGGTADTVAADNKGPVIKLFMNDFHFVNGGTTKADPLFLAAISDENGINTVGSGIGREITAFLDGNTSSSIIMNDYYQAKLNSYTEGEVKYNLSSLAAGKHSIKLRAWDVYNNSSEATLDFIVASDAGLALNHVLNYPNPFTTNTTFHFDHNKAGQPLQVQVQVFTVSGKLLRTLSADLPSAESHFDAISWNGRDDYGDKIGKGVYVYKVKVRSGDGEKVEKFEKLVILN